MGVHTQRRQGRCLRISSSPVDDRQKQRPDKTAPRLGALFVSKPRSEPCFSPGVTPPPTPPPPRRPPFPPATQNFAPDGAHPPPKAIQGPTAGPSHAQGKEGRREHLVVLHGGRSGASLFPLGRSPRPPPHALPAKPFPSRRPARALRRRRRRRRRGWGRGSSRGERRRVRRQARAAHAEAGPPELVGGHHGGRGRRRRDRLRRLRGR